MRKIFSFVFLAAAAMTLSGCYTTGSLKELRQTQVKGTPFYAALSKHYLEYAESEAAAYDWYASKYFADKGLLAAYGREVPPENPADWDLSPQSAAELTRARETLLLTLTDALKESQPEKAADAEYYFDCWVEQQEEAWQTEDIAACKDHFYQALHSLHQESAPKSEASVPAAGVQQEAASVKKSVESKTSGEKKEVAVTPVPTEATEEEKGAPVLTSSYIVFFPWNAALLTTDVKSTVDAVVTEVKDWKNYEVVLNGHTDRSGTEDYNLELSQKRADIVKAVLIKGGVPEKMIQTFAFGESDPKVKTADGVREKANRRVEIFINQ